MNEDEELIGEKMISVNEERKDNLEGLDHRFFGELRARVRPGQLQGIRHKRTYSKGEYAGLDLVVDDTGVVSAAVPTEAEVYVLDLFDRKPRIRKLGDPELWTVDRDLAFYRDHPAMALRLSDPEHRAFFSQHSVVVTLEPFSVVVAVDKGTLTVRTDQFTLRRLTKLLNPPLDDKIAV